MPFSRESLLKSPYNKCVICDKLGVSCDGPDFLCLSIPEWCAWCKLRRDYIGVTNEWIADKSGVSLITVNRIIAGKMDDAKVSTMQLVTKALVNGTWGQFPCANPEPEIVYRDNPDLVQQLTNLQKERERLYDISERRDAAHKAALQEAAEKAERDAQKKVDYLKSIIRVLSIVCAILLVLVFVALIIDAANPNVGFFWRTMAAWVGGGNTADAIRYLRG